MKQEKKKPNMVLAIIFMVGAFIGAIVAIETTIEESLVATITATIVFSGVGGFLAIMLFYYIVCIIVERKNKQKSCLKR